MRGGVRGRAAALGPMLAAVLAAAAVRTAEACAVCGGALTAEDPMARGFYWGVLFMMAAPFAVAGAVAGWLLYAYRRAPGGLGAACRLWRVREKLRAAVGLRTWTHKESES